MQNSPTGVSGSRASRVRLLSYTTLKKKPTVLQSIQNYESWLINTADDFSEFRLSR